MLLAFMLAGTMTINVDSNSLSGLPVVEAQFTAHEKTQRCSGPSLASVLAKAGVPHGNKVSGPKLQTSITAKARDGYAVLFSIGEVDTLLGNAAIIVATQCDGVEIPESDGPYRLVVPGEHRAARSVRQLKSLEIRAPE